MKYCECGKQFGKIYFQFFIDFGELICEVEKIYVIDVLKFWFSPVPTETQVV